MRQLNYFIANQLEFEDNAGNRHSLKPGKCSEAEYHFIFDDPENLVLSCESRDSVYDWIVLNVRNMFVSEKGAQISRYYKDKDEVKKEHCSYCSYRDICGASV
jgi:radical SAM protein with 4Fe4S-binding SPASM domain